MNKIIPFVAMALFSQLAMADDSLDIDGLPLVLTLQDNRTVSVSNCDEFIKVRKAGGVVKELPDLPNDFYDGMRMELIDCYVKAVVSQRGLMRSNAPKPSLSEILHHLPATEKLLISDDEKESVEKKFKGKSIWDAEPDLTSVDDTVISKKNDDGYKLINYTSYTSKDGNKVDLVTMVSFVLHGTYAYSRSYFINSKEKNIWDVEELSVNSPLH
ncbi:hypothetical protein [Tatumella saanichensis]|uniref:hypothetical protein n=1 Tax=Tatumella saanichensis TaxID=480813 RepID=UPI0004A47A96|nr:hypothetical protein [Tatumella saanichensis]